MYVVGLTGGIGSGKSAVSSHLERKGIAVVDADVVSRQVVQPGSKALPQIAEHFGAEYLLADGQLDRARLRQKIFSDEQAKRWLEQLLHPLIHEEAHRQLGAATSAYALLVSPLLIEAGQTAICDQVAVVDVPESLQISRTAARDNNSQQQVERIIASQASRERRLQAATAVIDNSGGLPALTQRVDELHSEWLQLAAEKQLATEKPH